MLVYFMTIWNILRPFGIIYSRLYSLWSFSIFSRFGMFGPRKIWQHCCRRQRARRQGDRMSRWKSRPKVSQRRRYLSKSMHSFFFGKVPKTCVICKKNAQSKRSPTWRKFAQSGHLGCRRQWAQSPQKKAHVLSVQLIDAKVQNVKRQKCQMPKMLNAKNVECQKCQTPKM
jgi:hypothetical protein